MSIILSVIIPIYNAEKYLTKCLQSLLNQTFHEFELILINDGSTDSSGEICNKFAANDSRIICIHQKNLGVSEARNNGLKIAKGKYIGFVDADDWIENDMYEVLMECAERYKADIILCPLMLEYFGENIVRKLCVASEDIILTSKEVIEGLFKVEEMRGNCNKVYKRDLFCNVKFNNSISIHEDFLINIELNILSDTIVYHPIPKYHYRQVENSTCHEDLSIKYLDRWKASLLIYNKIKEKAPSVSEYALGFHLDNLIICAKKVLLEGKLYKCELEIIKQEIKRNLVAILVSPTIRINSKKHVLWFLLPYFISRKIFVWRKQKNEKKDYKREMNRSRLYK